MVVTKIWAIAIPLEGNWNERALITPRGGQFQSSEPASGGCSNHLTPLELWGLKVLSVGLSGNMQTFGQLSVLAHIAGTVTSLDRLSLPKAYLNQEI
ncbi:hypothetical protein H6G89_09300 [Oscillatoria sp. FACHB-1407]|uniref:hypothetical protein n=1 Tax=Oscillatoria sp. FACHB-1407 TaxID=2692847 RepID=UPI001682C307|nr:hypothetical protein [Oscillatoria sp. FACHB-1407]MBD2461240.1 hypothetical protein [Oscillatoria sp. FACHB-1407]